MGFDFFCQQLALYIAAGLQPRQLLSHTHHPQRHHIQFDVVGVPEQRTPGIGVHKIIQRHLIPQGHQVFHFPNHIAIHHHVFQYFGNEQLLQALGQVSPHQYIVGNVDQGGLAVGDFFQADLGKGVDHHLHGGAGRVINDGSADVTAAKQQLIGHRV